MQKLNTFFLCAEVFSVSAMTIKCFIQRTGIYQSLIMHVPVARWWSIVLEAQKVVGSIPREHT